MLLLERPSNTFMTNAKLLAFTDLETADKKNGIFDVCGKNNRDALISLSIILSRIVKGSN